MGYFLFVMIPHASEEDIKAILTQEGKVGTRMRRDGTFEVLFETELTPIDNDILPYGMRVYFVPESQYPIFGIKGSNIQEVR